MCYCACMSLVAGLLQPRLFSSKLSKQSNGKVFRERHRYKHGLNNFKDTKPKILSLLVFTRVCRLEIQSVMLVFSSSFVNYCPSNLISGKLSPLPPPCVNKYTVYTYTVCKRGGSMGSSEGRGPQTDITPAAKSLYRSTFLE